MNIEIIANYAEIVGGVAVLISLVFVGLEIRRNTKSSLSQTNLTTHESMANLSLEVGKDAQVSSLLRKGLLSFNKLDDDEEFQFLLLLTSLYRRFENVFYQNEKGLLDDGLWKGYSHSMTTNFNTEGGKEFLRLRKDSFSASFVAFLEASKTKTDFIPQ
jgi:hypothetical protein